MFMALGFDDKYIVCLVCTQLTRKANWTWHLLTSIKVVFILKAWGSRCKQRESARRTLMGCQWCWGHSMRGSRRKREVRSSHYLVFPKLSPPLTLSHTDATVHNMAVYFLHLNCHPLSILSSPAQGLPCRVALICIHHHDPSLQLTPPHPRLHPGYHSLHNPRLCLPSTAPRGSSQSWHSSAW